MTAHAVEARPAARALHLIVLMPVYNDWEVVDVVCRELDAEMVRQPHVELHVLIVDDGSSTVRPADLLMGPLAAIRAVHVLALRRNVGHQRAIAIGLAWVTEHLPSDAVLVMDADGQDSPGDIVTLLERFERHGRRTAVFAARRKRPESLLFKIFYTAYMLFHRVLTGFGVRIGNFSVIPAARVGGLLVSSDLWTHYAAAVVRSRIPMETVPVNRRERRRGRSTMDFVALVAHGLSAISVFRERVGTRLLVGAVAGAGLLALLFVLWGFTLFAGGYRQAIPTWAWIAAGLIAIGTFQAVLALFVLAFSIISQRDLLGFLPIRDYQYFVDDCQRLR
jgi:polyisoprenyl-phosphate glycosyltransferase